MLSPVVSVTVSDTMCITVQIAQEWTGQWLLRLTLSYEVELIFHQRSVIGLTDMATITR